MVDNSFVFVVCGGKEHIDALHFSLAALKNFSAKKIYVLTDSSRNEIAVNHENVIDVKTPEELTHHQASIFLKTSIHRYLPKGSLYCYLDTDVVALTKNVNEIFSEYVPPITFAADHCNLKEFSPTAVNCGCAEEFTTRQNELIFLLKKYRYHTEILDNTEAEQWLLQKLEEIKKEKLGYWWLSLKFNLSPRKFKLDSNAFYDKQEEWWHDKNGKIILYNNEPSIARIEKNSQWRWSTLNKTWISPEGKETFVLECNDLVEQISETFGTEIEGKNWQHWNGGVFVFGDEAHDFLDKWHEKTRRIFSLPQWKTRDQGTLIATVWENGLKNQAVLPQRYNFLADYRQKNIHHRGALVFEKDGVVVAPDFIHIYHHWADKKWDVWQGVESRTNLVFEKEEETVNALWVGNVLSPLELLTIHSFLAHGHIFKLWLYDKVETPLPSGILIGDANEIIPREKIFRYNHKNQFGHGKGSYAGFSDIFRYKLLYEYGGWWTDMDVTCLKSLAVDNPYFFRTHHELNVVGNVMKCPKRSELMKRCYEEASREIDDNNTNWHKPIEILNRHITHLHLSEYKVKDVSNHDLWEDTSRFIFSNEAFPEHWHFIHWQNEEWRNQHLEKTNFYHMSTLAKLLSQYKLYNAPEKIRDRWYNEFVFSDFYRRLKDNIRSL